ncbi:MAG: ABC transporter ATP-binding protein [Chloroflexota bacterium]|nr:ABC transporter ATP-binding protein [Chloroflexota bacterium]
MAGPILNARGLVMDFGGVRAVNDCAIEVEKASITGLIGPNGAGKTTVFNLIAGFHKPTAGQVSFRDRRIEGLPPHLIFGAGIVRTFQVPRELKRMSVLENLMLVPSAQAGESIWRVMLTPWAIKRQEREIADRARQVLDFTGLSEVADLDAGSLSGGQKKLLELARTLMADPELVLLDEPGAGVNPTLLRRLEGGIRRARDELGITFLLIEHDMGLIGRLCDHVIVMEQGSVLTQGPPDSVQRDQRVIDAYLGG